MATPEMSPAELAESRLSTAIFLATGVTPGAPGVETDWIQTATDVITSLGSALKDVRNALDHEKGRRDREFSWSFKEVAVPSPEGPHVLRTHTLFRRVPIAAATLQEGPDGYTWTIGTRTGTIHQTRAPGDLDIAKSITIAATTAIGSGFDPKGGSHE